MDEQQMNEGLLCDADRQLIASAARSQKYVEAPFLQSFLASCRTIC